MLTTTQLERAFGVYFDEIEACVQRKCYWALLHLVLVLPDICAALESGDGRATGKRYEDWCRANVPSTHLSPEDRYSMRCRILHQGTSLSHGRFSSVSFVDPQSGLSHLHGTEQVDGTDINITIDVPRFAAETVQALRGWFAKLQMPSQRQQIANVEGNITSLVRVQRKTADIRTAEPDGRVLVNRSDGWTTSST